MSSVAFRSNAGISIKSHEIQEYIKSFTNAKSGFDKSKVV